MNGPKVLFEIPLFGGIKVTESIVNMWIIMAALVIVSVWLTHGMRVRNPSKKQLVAEKIITMLYNLVKDTMGEKYMSFAPYIGTLFIFSIVGSLSSLTGLRPITAGFKRYTFVVDSDIPYDTSDEHQKSRVFSVGLNRLPNLYRL